MSARSVRAKSRFLAGYDPKQFPSVAVTVDLVVLTVRDEQLSALLIQRGEPPFKGKWALPGGFVRANETLDQAAGRELKEETGLQEPVVHLEQLRSYGEPHRDPRMRVVTVAYIALLPALDDPVAGTDAACVRFWPINRLPKLAFDHERILADGIERARSKLEYTSLATAFCSREFSLAELRRVYEIVWAVRLDPANFRRKVLGTPKFVVPTGKHGEPGRTGGRPAKQYRAGSATMLQPPLLRSMSKSVAR